MRYVLAGKSDTYWKYLKDSNFKNNSDAKYMHNHLGTFLVKKDDVIILLPGWWHTEGKISAVEKIKKNFPDIEFEYRDGVHGKRYRNEADEADEEEQKNKPVTRFDLLDMDSDLL